MNTFTKVLLVTVVFLAVTFFGLMTYTTSHSPAETIKFTKGDLKVEVEYCRPFRKDRKVFGELVPYGQVWRTGANAATIISVNRDATIAGKSVKAGAYTLWTIPGETDWQVVLNKETGQWGTNYNEAEDVFRVAVPAEETDKLVEQFTMKLAPAHSGADLTLMWENTQVVVPIR